MNINRAENGHIKLHRSINDSDLAEDNNAFVAFIRMVGFAHWEDDFTSVKFNGKQRYLKRGEFAATLNELSDLTHIPVGTLRRVIERLKESERLETQSDNRKTIFRICNYAKYQDKPTNDQANDRTNNRANSRTNTPDAKRNKEIKKLNIYIDDYQEALKHWSELKGRKMMDTNTSREDYKSLRSKGIKQEEILRSIEGAVFFSGKPYKPQVQSFGSMYAKWDKLQEYMHNAVKGGMQNASNRFE